MAASKTSVLIAASVLTGPEYSHCVQGGLDRRWSADQIAAYANVIQAGTPITASGTFPSADYGKLVLVTAATVAVTLPAATGLSDFTLVDLWYTGGAGTAVVPGLGTITAQDHGRLAFMVLSNVWNQIKPASASGSGSGGGITTPYAQGDGRYKTPKNILANGAAGVSVPINTLLLLPVLLETGITITELAYRVSTAGTNATFALYVAATNKMPTGAPIALGGSQVVSTTGDKTITGLSVAVTQDWNWLAVAVDNAATVFNTFGSAAAMVASYLGVSNTTNMFSGAGNYLNKTITGMTLPTLTGSFTGDSLADGAASQRFPLVGFKC